VLPPNLLAGLKRLWLAVQYAEDAKSTKVKYKGVRDRFGEMGCGVGDLALG
jgi:hypothetical protein